MEVNWPGDSEDDARAGIVTPRLKCEDRSGADSEVARLS